MDYKRLYLDSFLGGIAIGIGCCGHLSCENKIIGALLFSIGLLMILGFRWKLFTGMLCSKAKISELLACYIGNFIGIRVLAALYFVSRYYNEDEVAYFTKVAEAKIQKPILSTLCSAILCEICIFIAVIGYKKVHFVLGKYFSVVLGVMIFVISGFEHSIADMFYTLFAPRMSWSDEWRIIIFLTIVTAGNVVGAWLIRSIVKD